MYGVSHQLKSANILSKFILRGERERSSKCTLIRTQIDPFASRVYPSNIKLHVHVLETGVNLFQVVKVKKALCAI